MFHKYRLECEIYRVKRINVRNFIFKLIQNFKKYKHNAELQRTAPGTKFIFLKDYPPWMIMEVLKWNVLISIAIVRKIA